MLTMIVTANAIPAKRGMWRTITLADGASVQVQLMGDEFAHYWKSADGRCFSEREDGTFAPADIENMLGRARKMHQQRAASNARKGPHKAAIGHEHSPIVGQKKGIIILVEFTNEHFAEGNDQALFDRIANEENFKEGSFRGSVHDYFFDQSNGQFDLTFDVVGPVQMDTTYQYYGKDHGGQGNDIRPGLMVATACQMVDPLVDFNDYDWDGDGMVDQVFIIYAGKGQADGGNSSTIWPHEWELQLSDYGQMLTLDNCTINTYACGNERKGWGDSINGIGTICHEFSHCLGFPDLYDLDGSNFGMGSWDMMDSGCYNGDSFLPSGYSAYEKWVAGWIEPIVLGGTSLSVKGMKPQSENGDAYMIINPSFEDEYYILENRDQSGWDGEIPGKGMLIHHVDYNSELWGYNIVNTTSGEYAQYNDHERCTIFKANNSDYNPSGHPYPNGGNNSLSDTSVPRAFWYNLDSNGSKDFKDQIENITLNNDKTISFDYIALNGVEEIIITSEDDLLFHETFDKNSGTGGNDSLWSGEAGNATFMSDYVGWKGKNKFGADQCAKVGLASSQGEITSPAMQAAGVYELTFKAAPWQNVWQQVKLKVLREAGGVIYKETFPVMERKQWNEYKVTFESEEVIRLYFTTTRFQFFLDEVKLVRISGPSGIQEVKANSPSQTDNVWYMLDGRKLDAKPTTPGIYVTGGKKVVVR